jgi:hypothetical protein
MSSKRSGSLATLDSFSSETTEDPSRSLLSGSPTHRESEEDDEVPLVKNGKGVFKAKSDVDFIKESQTADDPIEGAGEVIRVLQETMSASHIDGGDQSELLLVSRGL